MFVKKKNELEISLAVRKIEKKPNVHEPNIYGLSR